MVRFALWKDEHENGLQSSRREGGRLLRIWLWQPQSVISDRRGLEDGGCWHPGSENMQLVRIPLRGVVSPEKQRQVAA